MELEVMGGPDAGMRILLSPTLVVGRSMHNDLVLHDSASSKVHCRFQTSRAEVTVTDLGSTNGTFVNGIRILQARLIDGDCILIGDTLLRFHACLAENDDSEVSFLEERVQEDVFGQIGYSLVRKIADGGMGAIYEAVQYGAEGFEKCVAIKTILPELSEQDDFVEAFVDEARLVADLVHPNIVQIYHFGRHAGGYYIAMEYVDGLNLTDFCDIHKALGISVPVFWAVYLTSAVARGLAFAHFRQDADGELLGIVHRDVSPNNILIGWNGGVKLADFGVARAARESVKHDCDLVGCIEFMSPEQADCLPLDGRSDQFSLGLIFYELLTGVRLFLSNGMGLEENLDRVKAAHIPHPQDYVNDLPEDVCVIVCKMLRRDKTERYRDSEMVADACDAYLRYSGCLLTDVDFAAYIDEILSRYTGER